MISAFFHTVFYQPLLNLLVVLVALIPSHDLGFAIIAVTLLVRFAIMPLTHRATVTQQVMRTLEPEIAKIKEDYKDKKEEQARRTMELYRKHGINPFSGFLLLLIQLPLLIALYLVFLNGFNGEITKDLYSFVRLPENINTLFLGFIDLTKRSIALAVIAGITQYIQGTLSIPPASTSTSSQGDFTKMMQTQMRFMFPILILFIGLRFAAAVSLYWTVTNVFAILHESWVRFKASQPTPHESA